MLLRDLFIFLFEWSHFCQYLLLNLFHFTLYGIKFFFSVGKFEYFAESAYDFTPELVKDKHDVLPTHGHVRPKVLFCLRATRYQWLVLVRTSVVLMPHVPPNPLFDMLYTAVIDNSKLRFLVELPVRTEVDTAFVKTLDILREQKRQGVSCDFP